MAWPRAPCPVAPTRAVHSGEGLVAVPVSGRAAAVPGAVARPAAVRPCGIGAAAEVLVIVKASPVMVTMVRADSRAESLIAFLPAVLCLWATAGSRPQSV